MSSFKYKPQQQLALDYKGNIAISAGAGSGKTRVLVEKYFRMLAYEHPHWPLDSVVAITFTVKAAGELRARIVKRIREELAEAGIGEATRTRLLEMRREIAGAPIGTIHNFCSRVLREFAFEARLNPDFQIVEGAHESSLRRDAVHAAVAEAASDPSHLLYANLLVLLSLYSRGHLYRILEGMLRRRAEFAGPVARFTSSTTDQLFRELLDYQAAFSNEVRSRLVSDIGDALSTLSTQDAGGTAGGFAKKLKSRLDGIIRNGSDWLELCELSGEVQKALFTQKGDLLAKVEKESAIKRGDQVLTHLWNLCCDCGSPALKQPAEADRENLEVTAMLARLYLRAEELYAESRGAAASAEEVDLLDFADLEILAERLISSKPQVRRHLRERINYLIIDEFQDTSEIQWRILGPVVSTENHNLLPGKFFIVGDPKQGVYGFRQASVRIFNHVRQLVVESNPDESGDCRGAISINYNFRTLPRPLNLVNDLFSSLMQADKRKVDQVVFEPLIPERAGDEGQFDMLMTTEMAPDDLSAEIVLNEVEMVVDRISNYLAAGGRSPGDIVVLLRKRKHFESYERALRTRGIPYITHRGKGLYEQPEALAILAVLRLLAQPDSDLVAAEVARGPLVNFSDDLLLKISLVRGRNYLEKILFVSDGNYEIIDSIKVSFDQSELLRIQHLERVYRELTHKVGMEPVDSILRWIYEVTGALAIFGVGERAGQSLANLERFVEIARDMGTMDLDEFLAYVDSELVDTGGQAEAAEETDQQAAVRIMTIHAAKGLEFPVVFLPDLADPIQPQRDSVMTDGEQWMAVRKAMSSAKEDLFLPAQLEEVKRERAAGEEKRVLYVAMTRCRDELVLSCTRGRKREQDSFFGWIASELDRIGIRPLRPEQNEARKQGQPNAVRQVALHDNEFYERLAACVSTLNLCGADAALQDNPFAPAPLVHESIDGLVNAPLWIDELRGLGYRLLQVLYVDGLDAAINLVEIGFAGSSLPASRRREAVTAMATAIAAVSANPDLHLFLTSPELMVGHGVAAFRNEVIHFRPDLYLPALQGAKSVYVSWMPDLLTTMQEMAKLHTELSETVDEVFLYDAATNSLIQY